MAKLDKKERKKYKKTKAKDKITIRDARILTGGRNAAENVSLSKFESTTNKVSSKSKQIKKGSGYHEITRESVHHKL